MKSRPPGHRTSPTAGTETGREGSPTLPAWKAFVVQFSIESGTRVGVFSGRVEHLNTGRRARFTSDDDLVAVMKRMLAEIEKPPS